MLTRYVDGGRLKPGMLNESGVVGAALEYQSKPVRDNANDSAKPRALIRR